MAINLIIISTFHPIRIIRLWKPSNTTIIIDSAYSQSLWAFLYPIYIKIHILIIFSYSQMNPAIHRYSTITCNPTIPCTPCTIIRIIISSHQNLIPNIINHPNKSLIIKIISRLIIKNYLSIFLQIHPNSHTQILGRIQLKFSITNI